MAINIYPESPIISLCSSPRISFSHDLADHNTNTNSTPTAIRSDHTLIQNFNTSQDDDDDEDVYDCSSSSLDIVDFNFCVPASGFDQQFISPADQLFSGGMIIPTDDNNNNPKQQQQQQQQSLEKMMNKKKVVTLNSSIPKPNSNSINPSSRDNNNDIGDKTRENLSSSATKSKSKSKSTAKGSAESTGAAVMLIREEKSNTSSAAAAAAGGGGGSSSSSKSSSSSTSFWGFKRSSSCNCDGGNYQTKKSSIWSALPLLARSNSTGSSPKHTSNKANSSTSSSSSSTTTNSTTSSTSNKHLMKSLSLTSNLSVNQNGKPPPRKSSSSGSYHHHHHQQGSGGALMSMNGNGSVLNVPPPYIIKGTSDLLGLGSLFRNGNVNKDKKSSSNKKR